MLRDTIVAWKEVTKAFSLPFLLSKYMLLWGHPEFPHNNNLNLYYKGIFLAKHAMHLEDKRLMFPEEVMELYALPRTSHFKIMQILSLCRSRLREGTNNLFDALLDILSGEYGVSQKASPTNAFKSWEGVLSVLDHTKVIL